MSAPADVSAPAPASTPSASSPTTTSTPPAGGASSAGTGERPRIDPHTTWEQFRAAKGGAAKAEEHVDTPRVTPESLKAWLDERKAAEPPEDAEAGDAKAQTARATEDVQKAAAEATAKATPDPKPPREFKVKVKGEEIPVPLEKFAALVKLKPETVEYIAEHEGEAAARQLYQRLHHGDESARAHGTLQREVAQAFAGLKTNTLDALDYLAGHPQTGFDLLDAAYQIVQRDIDVKALTPEGKRLREVETQLRQMQAREQRDTAERERIVREAQESAERGRIQNFIADFHGAIGTTLAEAGLPQDDYHRGLVRAALQAEMAAKGDAYREPNGVEEMKARALAHIPTVKAQIKAALKALYANPDPETVQEFMAEHPELYQASAKHRVAEYKKNSAAQGNGKAADNRGTDTTPKISDQWRDDLRRRA